MISLHFALGMIVSFLLSLFFRYICKMSIPYSMLLSLAIGFFVTAVFEWAKVHQFFPDNSEEYRRVFVYFKRYWHLILINFLYTLGLFIHNFVFWATLEHKMHYKFEGDGPDYITKELRECARYVAELDARMEELNNEIQKYGKLTDKKMPQ